jgi:hypothetical protein
VIGQKSGYSPTTLPKTARDSKQTESGFGSPKDGHAEDVMSLSAIPALIEMTIPDKPQSSKQKYRLSDRDVEFLSGGKDLNAQR